MIPRFIFLALVCLHLGWINPSKATPITEDEAHNIAIEAYLYFYPLITMDVSRRQFTNIEPHKMIGRGPMNTFAHIRAFPTADFKEVVRPNFDTLYSSAWLDLTKGPQIVSAPNTQGRFYMLPMLDMWSDVFAAPGARTSGTEAKSFAVLPPGWNGKLPKAVEPIQATTPYVWIIGRTQTNGPADYQTVHKVQDGFTITPLASWNKKTQLVPKVAIDPTVDMKTPPLEQVHKMGSEIFFEYGAKLLRQHGAHPTDWSQVERLKRIGIDSSRPMQFNKLDHPVRRAMDRAVIDAPKIMAEKLPTLAKVKNGWQMNTDSMGVYGHFYLKRAIVAMVGLGANQPEDAVYPMALAAADGKPVVGEKNYVLHFRKQELPPVTAFWSITLYDAQGFPAKNQLNRFAIGDRDALKFNEDGSLDIYIQSESPGPSKEANWLPASKGPLGITMRLYGPKLSVIDGRWNPPPLKVD